MEKLCFPNFWLNYASVIWWLPWKHDVYIKWRMQREIIIWETQRENERLGHLCGKRDGWLTQTKASPCKNQQLTPCRELGTAITKQEKGEQREMKRHEYIRKEANWLQNICKGFLALWGRLACPPSSHSACIPQLLTSYSSSSLPFYVPAMFPYFISAE